MAHDLSAPAAVTTPVAYLGTPVLPLMAVATGLCAGRASSAAPRRPRLAGHGQATSAVSVLLLVASWACLLPGATSLGWFLLGLLLIDIGLAGLHISNQNVIYQLEPDARARINAVYMTAYFTGAATGSALGTLAWRLGGWPGICLLGAALAVLSAGALWHDQRLLRGAR